jgi:hypothetical protein
MVKLFVAMLEKITSIQKNTIFPFITMESLLIPTQIIQAQKKQ